jgi:hypothetical protein
VPLLGASCGRLGFGLMYGVSPAEVEERAFAMLWWAEHPDIELERQY